MDHSLEKLRRAAKKLRKSHQAGDAEAQLRLRLHLPAPKDSALRHADFLHVIAREQNFASWPEMKLAVEMSGMDRVQKQERLKTALYLGQNAIVQNLLSATPDLADGMFGLQCALYDRAAVAATLAADPTAATRKFGPRRAMLHLTFSKHIQAAPEREADMLAIADMLIKAGADVNDSYVATPSTSDRLSALYGAIGHADNMALGQWLLDRGADPDDGESLYHACELSHSDGLRMLLAAGANPEGTNALLRAMDFEDTEKLQLLMDAGGGSVPVAQLLHHAARRMCGRKVVDLVLAGGMEATTRHQGLTPYAMARMYGNTDVADAIVAAGGDLTLTKTEAIFAVAAEGGTQDGTYLDTATLPDILRGIIGELVSLPDCLEHIRRLVALGVEYDLPNSSGVPPVQLAGWEGKPDVLTYLMSLCPDLSHVNGFGGTLLSTIIHGSENCPARSNRNHIECARFVLTHGVALPRRAIEMAGDETMLAFLQDWATAHPGYVTEG